MFTNREFLAVAANLVNPVLGGTLLLVTFVQLRHLRGGLRWRFLFRALAGLAVVYLLHNLDAWFHLWARFGLDYSTHSAVAVSLATSIVVADPHWLVVLLPVLGGYGWVMAYLGYHTPADMGAAAVAAFLVTWVWHLQPRQRKSAEETA